MPHTAPYCCRLGHAAGLLLIALAISACGAGSPDAELAPPTERPLSVPTATQAATPEPTAETAVSGDLDVPYQITGYEMIAADIGPATYSGYTCVLTPDGCACELPAIHEATFTFRPDGLLEARFEREDGEETWEMGRAAPNQWDYRFAVISEGQSAAVGEGIVLLSFTETGYVVNQLVNFGDGSLVTCPEVSFRRLAGGE